MNAVTKKSKYFLFSMLFLLLVKPVVAQVSRAPVSKDLRNFYNKLSAINLNFTFPDGFKEIKTVNTNNMAFDYAMEIPDADFEIWLQVNTQKENEKIANERNIHVSPDSLYVNIAETQCAAFSDDKNNYFTRGLPPYILERYGADAGRTYLLNLTDSPVTKHYKYGLLIILQKNGMGTVSAICFTNEKGPDFFKNMNKASNCLKFK
jgi:hypothetical protein